MSDANNSGARANPCFHQLHILGAGGFGREVAWLAAQALGENVAIGFVVDQPQYLKTQVNGLPIRLLTEVVPSPNGRYVVAVGDPLLRERFAHACDQAGHMATTLVHPNIEMSRWVEVGSGTIICANCVVTCNVTIGRHVQINLGSTVGHDAIVGDYSTISPGVHISGNVHLGRGVFVGTNAAIINGNAEQPLCIGDGAIIAAGACVIHSVAPHTMVAGVPAVRKR